MKTLTPTNRPRALWRGLALASALALVGTGVSGCAVVAIADTAASAVIGVGGLAVDAAIGTVRIAGKVVGAGADAVLGSDSDE